MVEVAGIDFRPYSTARDDIGQRGCVQYLNGTPDLRYAVFLAFAGIPTVIGSCGVGLQASGFFFSETEI